ncbi:NUDIX domain-containing protein [uncultured Martelella sp.]|uniref:NUDIX hydrolase n=1 Tax=uncultured Martelella sp. TaxID=392331 RepID=UPI0029C85359|nr:NUDIX domain-containing protein [uncultured Martelella sp.]
MKSENIIRIAVALIINEKGEMLTVRKRGTEAFMQPGGKIDAEETPREALIRELNEELALIFSADDFHYQGRFSELAANEPGMIVEAEAFSCFAAPEVTPQAEIEELKWLPVEGDVGVKRAALTEKHLFPIAARLSAERNRVSS